MTHYILDAPLEVLITSISPAPNYDQRMWLCDRRSGSEIIRINAITAAAVDEEQQQQ